MKICVLLPDYSTSDVDYQNYDPPRNLSHLLPECSFNHIFLNKLTTYQQLKKLQKEKYDIYVNLCEGYLEWSVPSIDVINSLDLLKLPYTGPTALLYDPPKNLMKYVAYCANVLTPQFTLYNAEENLKAACKHLQYPLFVKPAKAGDSLGIDKNSLVNNFEALNQKVNAIIDEYDELLIEEYIDGREFTVLVVASANDEACIALQPIEFIFPPTDRFKTYALKTSELHPNANIPVSDKLLSNQLKEAAIKIFKGFNGEGYARLDFRMNDKGQLFFLEINFTCSVFYTNGYEGSADYILNNDPLGKAGFLKHIISEGVYRHQKKQNKYLTKGNSIAGYGIYAAKNLLVNEVVFNGEGRSQRIITKKYVDKNWSVADKEIFSRYAYPISNEVFLLWDNNPAEWAPQNHSCNPNTAYNGLNVVAIQPINKGEELTLDYATILDEHMEPFVCKCGSASCRGFIKGIKSNSITFRENLSPH